MKKALNAIGAGLTVIFIGAAGLGINTAYGNAVFPAEKGITYLENRGYRDVEGGSRDYFNMCAEDDTARSYTAIHPETGERVNRTVCHNLLLGAHAPALGLAY
jgi:hypothetical protein